MAALAVVVGGGRGGVTVDVDVIVIEIVVVAVLAAVLVVGPGFESWLCQIDAESLSACLSDASFVITAPM